MSPRSKLTIDVETFALAKPFVIARGSRTETQVIKVSITVGNITGHGECVPTPRYGENVELVVAAIESVREQLEGEPCLDKLQYWLPAGAARNALDCALWDLKAKQQGKSVAALVGYDEPNNITTVQTISIGTPEAMRVAASELANYAVLKIKLNRDDIVERLQAVHQGAPKAKLVVDANESWSFALLTNVIEQVKHLPIVMIEQPLPAGEDDVLLGQKFPIIIGADESCHTCDDIEYLALRYDMVNIKLDKCGGLSEGMKLAAAARANGLAVMVGCMVGTSLSMAPGLVLATQASLVDLDAPLLLKTDRPFGLTFEHGVITSALDSRLWG